LWPPLRHEFLPQIADLFNHEAGLAVLGPIPALMGINGQGQYRIAFVFTISHRSHPTATINRHINKLEKSRFGTKVALALGH